MAQSDPLFSHIPHGLARCSPSQRSLARLIFYFACSRPRDGEYFDENAVDRKCEMRVIYFLVIYFLGANR